MPKVKKAPKVGLHKNKVFVVLSALGTEEHKRLIKFLQSPYFNQSKTLTRLYQIFLECIEKEPEGFNKEFVWKKLFPASQYDDVNFRKYSSDLLKLIEGFMAHEMLSQDEARQAIDVLDYTVKRKIEPFYQTALRDAREKSDKNPFRSLSYYLNSYSIERHYYSMMDFDVKLDARPNIEAISYNLDLFYWIEKLKIYIAALSQQKTRNFQYSLYFMDEIVDYLKTISIENIPELSLYFYSFLTLQEENNTEHYYNLRKLLDKHGGIMPQKEATELYDLALHYCTGKLNKGDRVFLQEYFDLFEAAILKGVFLIKGELAPWRFNNAVAAALLLGKLDWAENFVEKNRNYLPADSRENTYTFNLARVYRYQQKYDKVLHLLRNVEYEDIGYNLISKAVLIITYYEMDELDALDSFIESFRVFLNRHKNIPAQRRKSYLNLIKYVRRLTRLMPGDKIGLEKLRQEIIREKAATVNHEWLLEKLAEMD